LGDDGFAEDTFETVAKFQFAGPPVRFFPRSWCFEHPLHHGSAETGGPARQLLAQSGRLARSEVICVVWSGLPGHWIDSLDSGIGHSIPSFSEIIRVSLYNDILALEPGAKFRITADFTAYDAVSDREGKCMIKNSLTLIAALGAIAGLVVTSPAGAQERAVKIAGFGAKSGVVASSASTAKRR